MSDAEFYEESIAAFKLDLSLSVQKLFKKWREIQILNSIFLNATHKNVRVT
jgi:hypothetical protein